MPTIERFISGYVYDLPNNQVAPSGTVAVSDVLVVQSDGGASTYAAPYNTSAGGPFNIYSMGFHFGVNVDDIYELAIVADSRGANFIALYQGGNVSNAQDGIFSAPVAVGHQYRRELIVSSDHNSVTYKLTDLNTGASESQTAPVSHYSSAFYCDGGWIEWHVEGLSTPDTWTPQYATYSQNYGFSSSRSGSYDVAQSSKFGLIQGAANTDGSSSNANAPNGFPLNGYTINAQSAPSGGSSTVDDNGVKHLYTPMGENFVAKSGTSWWSTSRVMFAGSSTKVITYGDSTYGTDGNDAARILVTTSAGYDASKIVTDFSKLDVDNGGRGYMMDIRDWTNCEIGFYFRISDWSAPKQINLFLRGGRHYNPPAISCEGFAYQANITYADGKTHFTKESYHGSGGSASTPIDDKLALGSLKNKWIGIKFVAYDATIGDVTAVNCELYIDPDGLGPSLVPANNWVKVDDFQDAGSFGSGTDKCGASSPTTIGNWGGPLAIFSWDGINPDGIKFAYLHAFEIDPTGTGGPAPGPPPPGPAPPTVPFTPSCPNSAEDPVPSGQIALISKHRFNLGDFADPLHCALPGEGMAPPPSGGGGGPPPPGGGNIGPDGVLQIYPTVSGGTEFYLNMDDPYSGPGPSSTSQNGQFNVSYGSGSQFPITKKTDSAFGNMTYWNTHGSKVTYASGSPDGRSHRLDVYPDGGKWNNSTSYSWKNNPGYLYTQKGIRSQEVTYFFRGQSDLGSSVHHAAAYKIGGRDEDDIRSCIEMVYPTVTHDDVELNYNYAHFPYVGDSSHVNTITKPPRMTENVWIGCKVIKLVDDSNNFTDLIMYANDTPFNTDGTVNNDTWYKAATYHDTGPPSGYTPRVACYWRCHKDLLRVDGFDFLDFSLISDREVDVTANPAI